MARKKNSSAPIQRIPSREAAALLGITRQGLHKIVARGELSAVPEPGYIGFRYLFDRREVERLADERKKNPPKRGPKPEKVSP